MFIVVSNDNEGILKDLIHIGCDRGVANDHFIGACESAVSNWSSEDIDDVLDDGYCQCGAGGVILLIDTDGYTSDQRILASLTKTKNIPLQKGGHISHSDLCHNLTNILLNTTGKELARIWNEFSEDEVVYEDDDSFLVKEVHSL